MYLPAGQAHITAFAVQLRTALDPILAPGPHSGIDIPWGFCIIQADEIDDRIWARRVFPGRVQDYR